jgi:AcrR family transcriptional regulator
MLSKPAMVKAATARKKPREEARKVRSDLYRRHILEAAEGVFAERGFEAAKLQEISAACGLSMGTIYSIFPSKEDICRALLDERGAELLRLARDAAARDVPAKEALDGLIESYVDYFVTHPTFLRMHLRLGGSWVLAPGAANGGRLRLWEEIHEHHTAIFRRGIAEGTFLDEEPEFLAKLLSAMDQVLLADWASRGMKASRDRLVTRMKGMSARAFHRSTEPR